MMRRIRPVALAIIRRGEELLVFEGYDEVKAERFLRPLGGGIEFGELGHDAVRREIREELGVELNEVRHLATIENIFTCNGEDGHEIVMLYEAVFADETLYGTEQLDGREGTEPLPAFWVHPARLDGRPLYPDGLSDLLS
jgi:ADP-ribose pyrophosphatase YjhB (NUDIX family)